MLKITNTEVYGIERAIVASGFSFKKGVSPSSLKSITDKDWERGERLGKAQEGTGHSGFLKGIIVQFDITYPQYWSMEFQRYHFAEIVMSSSKMHCLCKAADDSFDEFKKHFNSYVDDDTIHKVMNYAKQYNECKDGTKEKYELFMKMQSNLPMGYELTMMITTNYEQLKTIFNQRKNHRLKEDWGAFCNWCLTLPKFSELTGCSL